MSISSRLSTIKPSPTLAISARANELKAQGRPVINLSVGEPDFDTPETIKQAAIQAIQRGETRYTAVDGTPALKDAIIHKFKHENNLSFTPKEVMVSTGAKHSLYNIMQAMINPGDEVIIPAPYWVSYPDMARLAGGVPVTIEASFDQHLKISPEQLEKAITKNTKLVILNTPSNPTGIAYHRAELSALADVLLRHPHVWVISDDIYEHILWRDEPFSTLLNVAPALRERTFTVNGVSKAYAMTGWRIGYVAAPEHAVTAMRKIQSQSTSNPCSIAQAAAVEALIGDQRCVKTMVSAFKKRHDLVIERLNQIEGIQALKGDGTFYAFINVEGVLQKHPHLQDDLALGEHLINEAEVATVPGSAFGSPGHLRLSYALDEDALNEAIDRIAKAVV